MTNLNLPWRSDESGNYYNADGVYIGDVVGYAAGSKMSEFAQIVVDAVNDVHGPGGLKYRCGNLQKTTMNLNETIDDLLAKNRALKGTLVALREENNYLIEEAARRDEQIHTLAVELREMTEERDKRNQQIRDLEQKLKVYEDKNTDEDLQDLRNRVLALEYAAETRDPQPRTPRVFEDGKDLLNAEPGARFRDREGDIWARSATGVFLEGKTHQTSDAEWEGIFAPYVEVLP